MIEFREFVLKDGVNGLTVIAVETFCAAPSDHEDAAFIMRFRTDQIIPSKTHVVGGELVVPR